MSATSYHDSAASAQAKGKAFFAVVPDAHRERLPHHLLVAYNRNRNVS
jgi:hypothetical protein